MPDGKENVEIHGEYLKPNLERDMTECNSRKLHELV
jgi:hypothetical protein